MAVEEALLTVRDLTVDFDTPAGPVRAVDGISFEVRANETLCIVGESGSGKSVTMLAVTRLLPRNARIVSGEIRFRGRDLRRLPRKQMRAVRGRELAMVFQDPMTSFNPIISVGKQIDEMIRIHRPEMSRAQVRERSIELLRQIRVANPEARYSAYPHQFSGGMRQRAMIAMAMAHSPALLVADEPTTALDVSTQAQVLGVLRDMREMAGSAMVLITHDLGVVAENADRVVVMYGGRVMETGTVEAIFSHPKHPYTVGLMASMLNADVDSETAYAIPGQPVTPADRPSGCVFHPRCGLSKGRGPCATEIPAVASAGDGHSAACHYAEETEQWMNRDFAHLVETLDGVRP